MLARLWPRDLGSARSRNVKYQYLRVVSRYWIVPRSRLSTCAAPSAVRDGRCVFSVTQLIADLLHGAVKTVAVENEKAYAIGVTGVLNTLLFLSLVAPFIYRGPLEKSVDIYDTYSTLAGLVNSAAWLLYSVVLLKRVNCLDLVILNTVCYTSSFSYLLEVYKHSKSTAKANLLIVFTTLVFGSVFILLQVDLGKATVLELVFGYGSMAATVVFSVVQLLVQLFNGIRKVHVRAVLCSLFPNITMSIWTLADTIMYHNDRTVILVSSAIICGFQLIDLVLLTVAHHKAIINWSSEMLQIISQRIRGGHQVAASEDRRNEEISVRTIRRVKSAPAQLWMVREVKVPAPVANVAADLSIDEQRIVGNQGPGDLMLARLQWIRGIRRARPIDEETGYAQHVARAQPVQSIILMLWINQLRLIVINSRFVVSALAFFQRYGGAGG